MKRLIKVLTGAAGIAAVAGFASPAAAQYYPGYGGYGDNGGGVIGAIINSVIGYGRYPYGNYGYGQGGYGFDGQQQAVNVCARAAEAKINGYGYNQGGYGGYGGYDGYSRGYDNGYGYNGGYNGSGYNGGYGAQGRVVGISRVNRKNYGWHVYGVASTLPGGAPNLRIDCKVNRGPYVREVQVRRNMDGYRYGSGW